MCVSLGLVEVKGCKVKVAVVSRSPPAKKTCAKTDELNHS